MERTDINKKESPLIIGTMAEGEATTRKRVKVRPSGAYSAISFFFLSILALSSCITINPSTEPDSVQTITVTTNPITSSYKTSTYTFVTPPPKITPVIPPPIITPPPSTTESWNDVQAQKIATAINPTNSITRNYAVKLAAQFPGEYNVSQICAIWEWVYSNWKYVNDPKGNDYYATASDTIYNNLAGDCDDFAILIASLIEAIGGSARVVCAYNTTSASHAYPEVGIGNSNDPLTNTVLQSIANKYNTTVHFVTTTNGGVWLNLDWSAGHPGGPYFEAEKYIAFRSNGLWQELSMN